MTQGETLRSERRLKKITFEYDPREDRLLARVLANDGATSALWVTQRLSLRLVQALRSHLDRSAAAASPHDPEALLSFRHEAAVQRREQHAPVPESGGGQHPLLDSIDVRLLGNRTDLVLNLPDGQAVLSLSPDHVWQLLQILLDIFRRGEWPVDAWPAWMVNRTGAASGAPSGSLPSLH